MRVFVPVAFFLVEGFGMPVLHDALRYDPWDFFKGINNILMDDGVLVAHHTLHGRVDKLHFVQNVLVTKAFGAKGTSSTQKGVRGRDVIRDHNGLIQSGLDASDRLPLGFFGRLFSEVAAFPAPTRLARAVFTLLIIAIFRNLSVYDTFHGSFQLREALSRFDNMDQVLI